MDIGNLSYNFARRCLITAGTSSEFHPHDFGRGRLKDGIKFFNAEHGIFACAVYDGHNAAGAAMNGKGFFCLCINQIERASGIFRCCSIKKMSLQPYIAYCIEARYLVLQNGFFNIHNSSFLIFYSVSLLPLFVFKNSISL